MRSLGGAPSGAAALGSGRPRERTPSGAEALGSGRPREQTAARNTAGSSKAPLIYPHIPRLRRAVSPVGRDGAAKAGNMRIY